MSRRRPSHSETSASSSMMNEAVAYPYNNNMQNNLQRQSRGPIEGPGGRRLVRRVTWRSSTYKLLASLWVFGVLCLVWFIKDLVYSFTSVETNVLMPNVADDYLAQYVGRQECGISSQYLYTPPESGNGHALSKSYCQTRTSLLDAMSNGGRHGFDASYTPQGCFYRWYSTAQICDILQKLDGAIFIGDDSLGNIYAALNILLRENLAFGSLKEWEMTKEQVDQCRCDSQFTSSSCFPFRITSSAENPHIDSNTATRSPYVCSSHTPHAFLVATGSPASQSAHKSFHRLVAKSTGKKPIPVILSFPFGGAFPAQKATSSMDEWLAVARATGRHTPFLWVGPTAPGHQKEHSKGPANSAIWQYTLDTAEAAHERGMDTLGMYNATLQAKSWDGTHYGESVSLVQAMMIINWLSTL